MSNIKDIIKARQDLETAKDNAKKAEEAATREAEETAMKPFLDVYEELKDLPLRSASGYSVRKEKLSDICSRSSCASRIELYTGHGNQFRVSSDLHQGKIRFYVEHNKHNSGWLDFDEAFYAFLDTLARLVKVD
jgi:hypothetical protein